MFNENTKSAVDLLVIGAEWVYKKINNPKPITNAGTDPKYQDKKRYDILCNTYRQYIKPSMPPAWDIPPQWVLNGDSCPTFQTNFLESSNRLKKEREKLESNVYPLVNYISGMISSIEQLIIELEKETLCLT